MEGKKKRSAKQSVEWPTSRRTEVHERFPKMESNSVKGLGDVWRRRLHCLGGEGGWWWHCFILSGCCCLSIQRFQILVFNFFLPQGALLGFSKMLYPGTQACKEDHMRYLHAIRLWKTEVWIHCAVYSQIIFRLKLHHCSPYSHHTLILASVSPPVPIYMDPDQS